MIVLDREKSFFMVNQHAHAKISGEIANYWKEEFFLGTERKHDVVTAVYEHDRGWIDLDVVPLMNELEQRPYSFMDYPLASKLNCYRKGINEVELMSEYAGLLCSIHYASFVQNANDSLSKNFFIEEKKRQHRLLQKFEIEGKQKEKELLFHLNVLKFCDNLSLYISLNEPKVYKTNEHPFFREGFPQAFAFANHHPIHAYWMSKKNVSLSISPLEKELQVLLPYKDVKKKDIKDYGILDAYRKTPSSIRKVRFRQLGS